MHPHIMPTVSSTTLAILSDTSMTTAVHQSDLHPYKDINKCPSNVGVFELGTIIEPHDARETSSRHFQHQTRSVIAQLDLQEACPKYGTVTNFLLGRQLESAHGWDRQQENVEVAGNIDRAHGKTQRDEKSHVVREQGLWQTFTWTWYGHDAERDEGAGVEGCHKHDSEVDGISHLLTRTKDLKIEDQQG